MRKILIGFFAFALFASSGVRAETVSPPSLEFAFEELVTLAADIRPGTTPRGGRNIVPITGGHFEGPGIKGEILAGGWDWQLFRGDGCLEIKADYFLKTDDGVVINVVNTGVACPPVNGIAMPVRTHPVFEAPNGKYAWLNRSAFLGTLELAKGEPTPAVHIKFYKIL